MREAPEFFGATKGPCQAQDRTCGSWFWASASPWQAIVFADLKAAQEGFWVYTMVELAWGVATSVLKENAAMRFSCHTAGSVLCYTDLVARAGSVFAVGIATLRKSASLLLSLLDREALGYEIAGNSTEFWRQTEAGHIWLDEVPNQEGAKETTGLRIQIRDGFCWAKILYSILVSELKSTFFFCECSSSAVLHVVADVMAESCLFEFWLEQGI